MINTPSVPECKHSGCSNVKKSGRWKLRMCPYPSSRLLPPSSVAHLLPDGRRPWRPLSSPPVLLPIVGHRRTRACRDPRRRASAPAAQPPTPPHVQVPPAPTAAPNQTLPPPNLSLPRRIRACRAESGSRILLCWGPAPSPSLCTGSWRRGTSLRGTPHPSSCGRGHLSLAGDVKHRHV
jgi:hypothetical protein